MNMDDAKKLFEEIQDLVDPMYAGNRFVPSISDASDPYTSPKRIVVRASLQAGASGALVLMLFAVAHRYPIRLTTIEHKSVFEIG